jgi:endonuclease/exonuclease/phosphatase family metal-dependent hydrolase
MASIEERVRASLSPVPAETRAAILRGGRDAASHARWYDEIACLHQVQVAPPPKPGPARGRARVVAWNAERGRDVPALARVLRGQDPDVVLLSEMDLGMARSGNRHTAWELGLALGLGCVYGVEYVELGLGSPGERAGLAGRANREGLHGSAILSRSPLERPVVVRLERSGAWLAEERGEPRVGGRIAVLATWRLDGDPVTVVSVHLESHSDPAQRAAQMRELLAAVEVYAPAAPVLIGGDLNTFSLGQDDLAELARLRAALERDRGRLLHPVPYEPLFELARDRGFSWEECNVMREATHRVATDDASARGGLKLDWFLARGLVCSDPAVLEGAHPDDGRPLSDHEPIAVSCARRPV